jgi:hypothetical protein
MPGKKKPSKKKDPKKGQQLQVIGLPADAVVHDETITAFVVDKKNHVETMTVETKGLDIKELARFRTKKACQADWGMNPGPPGNAVLYRGCWIPGKTKNYEKYFKKWVIEQLEVPNSRASQGLFEKGPQDNMMTEDTYLNEFITTADEQYLDGNEFNLDDMENARNEDVERIIAANQRVGLLVQWAKEIGQYQWLPSNKIQSKFTKGLYTRTLRQLHYWLGDNADAEECKKVFEAIQPHLNKRVRLDSACITLQNEKWMLLTDFENPTPENDKLENEILKLASVSAEDTLACQLRDMIESF